MKVAKLKFSGQFEDAYLYRTRLLIFDTAKNLRAYNLEEISGSLKSYFDRIPFYQWLFERTDWLRNSQALSLFQSPGIADIALKALNKCAEEVLPLDIKTFSPENVFKFQDVQFDSILACIVYNGHIYLGTDAGLFHCRASWENTLAVPTPIKRHDFKVIHASARFGTIGLSCGHDGLFTAIEDYEKGTKRKFNQTESKSFSSNWCANDLINYSNYSNPHMFRTQTAKKNLSIERETTVLTGISKEANAVWDIPFQESKHKRKRVLEPGIFTYSFNTNRRFFGSIADGSLFEAPIVYDKEKNEPARRPLKRLKHVKKLANPQILSTHPIPAVKGVVIEHFDTVMLMHSGGLIELLDEPVHVLRTFPQSHQYQNLILAITDDALWLMSVFDDEKISKQVLAPDQYSLRDRSEEDEDEDEGEGEADYDDDYEFDIDPMENM